jgi:hypothetical protein
MSVLALTTSLFNAYDSAYAQEQQAAREAARAKSKAALSEVKPLAKTTGTTSSTTAGAAKVPAPASSTDDAPVSNLQVLRRAMDAHTIDVVA